MLVAQNLKKLVLPHRHPRSDLTRTAFEYRCLCLQSYHWVFDCQLHLVAIFSFHQLPYSERCDLLTVWLLVTESLALADAASQDGGR